MNKVLFETKEKIAKIIGILFLLFLIFGFFYLRYQDNKRDKNPRYTIGVVIKKFTSKSGTYYKTEYNVNDIEYLVNFSSDGDPDPVGKRFYIKFEKGNPENSELLYDEKVNKNITPPKEGWKEIPKAP
jgi:hypothetical protein